MSNEESSSSSSDIEQLSDSGSTKPHRVLDKTIVTTALISAIASIVVAWVTADRVGASAGSQQVDSLAAIPSGTVSFFNLLRCPKGWAAKANAQGRYLVGLNPSEEGSLNQTQGDALENLENRATGNHVHDFQTFFAGGAGIGPNPLAWGGRGGADRTEPIRSTNDAKAVGETTISGGTNAPYLQLTVCEKE